MCIIKGYRSCRGVLNKCIYANNNINKNDFKLEKKCFDPERYIW